MRHRSSSENNLIFNENGQLRTDKDIIKWGKEMIQDLSDMDRLHFAIKSLHDGLVFRLPRVDQESVTGTIGSRSIFETVYDFQTSSYWRTTLLALSYIFMFITYISITKPSPTQLRIQVTILILLWIDLIVQFLHRCCSSKSIFVLISIRFYVKIVVISVLTVDQVICFVGTEHVQRPFLILRSILPFFFDAELRIKFESLFALYKDFFVYLIFYLIMIFAFALAANNFIVMPESKRYDPFLENYGNLGRAIFMFYILSSYDDFPDDQIKAIEANHNVIILFFTFIFLNFIVFSTIPTSFLYKSFKENHSRQILMSEIRQQYSLVIAYIALSDHNLILTQKKFISFLFAVYHNKMRYIGYITQICLQINQTKSERVEMTDFLQLCKIIQTNSNMLPSKYKDWPLWVRFRENINRNTYIKKYVKNQNFELLIACLIFLSIVNCMFVLFNKSNLFAVIDYSITIIFCFEMLAKIIAFDLEDFFRGALNKFDFFTVIFMIIFQIYKPKQGFDHLSALIKLARFYRVPLIVKIIAGKKKLIQKNSLYTKSARLVAQIIVIFPIVGKFISIFAITGYFFGTIGILLFTGTPVHTQAESPYITYGTEANFHSFLSSQFIIVQILIESGWSKVTLDHAFRYGHTVISILYFVICHLVLVFILTSIFQGITWDLYETVHNQFNIKLRNTIERQNEQIQLNKKKEQLQIISEELGKLKKPANQKSILQRQIYENRIDQEIYNFMQTIDRNEQKNELKIRGRRLTNLSLIVDEIQLENAQNWKDGQKLLVDELMNRQDIKLIQDLRTQDIDHQIQRITKLVEIDIDEYPMYLWHPNLLKQLLEKKLCEVKDSQDDLLFGDLDILETDEAVKQIKSELNSLMGIKKTKNMKFVENLSSVLFEQGLQVDQQRVMNKQKIRSLSLDSHWVLRETFLSDISEASIKNFQLEYLSHVYPNYFNQMVDNLSIEPLLRKEAKLMYCFRNMLRFSQLNHNQFFSQLAAVEKKISGTLLKKGSLFKFVYQIDNQTQNWFTTEVSSTKQIKVHFIKNSIWIFSQFMRQSKIYIANDLFDVDKFLLKKDAPLGRKLMKLMFQSFQTMALSLENKQDFFSFEPHCRTYKLFSIFKNVQRHSYLLKNRLGVSKIMAVVLSNEGQRVEPLDYDLSNMQTAFCLNENHTGFQINRSRQEMLEKLKKIQFVDDTQINDAQGLSSLFITNLLVEIKDSLSIYSNNFTLQAERMLNNKFEQTF